LGLGAARARLSPERVGAPGMASGFSVLLSKQPLGLAEMKQVNKPDAALEVIKYRGYNLVPSQVGQGWRVAIFPVGSSNALPESPCSLEKCTQEDVLADARKIVDAI
jgi:hypothetical protein